MALDGLNKWIILGLQLGLEYSTLTQIESDYNGIDRRKMQMIAEWLQQHYNASQNGVPSWSVLQAALKRMQENVLASKIMVSCEYNTVMVCAVNKWSLSQRRKKSLAALRPVVVCGRGEILTLTVLETSQQV